MDCSGGKTEELVYETDLACNPGLRQGAGDYAVAYAPELNPEEHCNALVKHAMANALPGSVDDLHRLARREFSRLKRRPEMITSFFRHAGLSVAGLP